MKKIFLRVLLSAPFFLLAVPAFAGGVALKGRVVFDGVPPVSEKVEVKSDRSVCGAQKETSKIILGSNKGVANAVVKILELKEPAAAPKKGDLDQINCEFDPHVQALPVGSTLVLTSSDAVLHNAHAFYEDGSTAFNIAVPIVGMEVDKKLDKPGVIRLRCDAGHTWMNAYLVVVQEPFYAMTDKEGSFTIEGVPPGKYTVEIWQEWLGKTAQSVEVKEAENPPLVLTVKKVQSDP